MSTNCKWDIYCSSKKQTAKTACLENRKQERVFEEQFINLQYDGLVEQANLQYQICVLQCGGCQSCSCTDQCGVVRDEAVAAITLLRQQQLSQIKEKYECCDETLCETQSNYFYEWCCENNGPLAGDLRNSSSSWISRTNIIFEPPIGDRGQEAQLLHTPMFTLEELLYPDGIAVTRAEETASSDINELIRQTTVRDWEQYSRGIALCINLLIGTHHSCVEAATTEWKNEDKRITTVYNKDMTTCFDQYWVCYRSGTTSQQDCANRRAACEENAAKTRDAARKNNDDRYKGKTGRDIPTPRGTGQPIPNVLPPYKTPPCSCCEISDAAYARCRERAWNGEERPDREPEPSRKEPKQSI